EMPISRCLATTSTTAVRSTSRNSSSGAGVRPSSPTGRAALAAISSGVRGSDPAWVVRISVMPESTSCDAPVGNRGVTAVHTELPSVARPGGHQVAVAEGLLDAAYRGPVLRLDPHLGAVVHG